MAFYTGCQFLAMNSDIGSRLSVKNAVLGSRSRRRAVIKLPPEAAAGAELQIAAPAFLLSKTM